MAQQRFSNVAKSKLAGSIVAADTSLSVTAGDGAKFPALSGSDFFYATIQTSTTREIVKVTARSSDTLTIERGKEDTSAQDWTAGADVRLHVTAGWMETLSAFIVGAATAALAALTPAANKIPYFTSGSAAALLTRDTDGTLAGNSDTNIATQKAVKTYADTALALKAPLASPALTGSPTAPTQSAGDNSTKIATTAYTDTGLALKAPLASPTFTGTPAAPTAAYGTSSTQIATTAMVQAAVTTTVDDGNSGTADTIDFSAGNVHKSTLTGNVTYTFTAPPNGSVVVLKVIQGSGPYTITWPSAVHWPSGTAPTITATNAKVDVFTFLYMDSTYYSVASGQNYTA